MIYWSLNFSSSQLVLGSIMASSIAGFLENNFIFKTLKKKEKNLDTVTNGRR